MLTHWGQVTHICISELTIIGSDNGLSPGRRQAIIWNNAGLLLIEPLRSNFSEISIRIQTFSFKKMHLNMSSAKWRPFCLSLNVLTHGDSCHQFGSCKVHELTWFWTVKFGEWRNTMHIRVYCSDILWSLSRGLYSQVLNLGNTLWPIGVYCESLV